MSHTNPTSDDARFILVFGVIYGDASALPRSVCERLTRRIVAALDDLACAVEIAHDTSGAS